MQGRTAVFRSKQFRPALPAILFSLYVAALLLLVGNKPLWLDEIWQQLGTRNVSFAQMVSYAQQGAGGAFLPHFCQWAVLKFLPYSVILSRLPALLFGIGASVCFWFLSRRLNPRGSETALAVFLALPIIFRYALEARPYSQALFFCCWALLLLFQSDERPSRMRSLLLLLVATAILYSQPFAIFTIAAAVAAFTALSPNKQEKLLYLCLPIAASALLYVPWYLSANTQWSNGVSSSASTQIFDAKLPLRVLREYTGGGYVVGICLVILLALGCKAFDRHRQKYVLAAGFFGGLIFPLLAEQRLHYFYAARHLMFALPAGILLSAAALNPAKTRPQPVARAVLAVLLIASISSIAAREAGPHEDWQRVANQLKQLTEDGDCIVTAKPDGLDYFEFFQPVLKNSSCHSSFRRVVLVADPYTPPNLYDGKLRELETAGYEPTHQDQKNGFRMALLTRKSGTGGQPLLRSNQPFADSK